MMPAFILFVIALVFLPTTARAAWIPNGNPICALADTQNQVALAPDGAGGFYATWFDHRSGSAIYLTRVLGDGTIPAPWPADGMKISPSGLVIPEGPPGIAPDGSGGVLVLWKQTTLSGTSIAFQRIDDQGGISQPQGGSMLISNWTQSPFAVVPDGFGGAYVAWIGGEPQAAAVTRVNALGGFVAPFTASGVPIVALTSGYDYVQSLRLSADPSGGVGVAVEWIYDGPFVHYLARMGRVAPDASVPFVVSPYGNESGEVEIATDGSGGLFCSWIPTNSGPLPTYPRLQHYGPGGQKEWPDTTRFAAGWRAPLVSDGGGGAYVVETPSAQRIQARRLIEDGSLAPGWPVNGIVIALDQNATERVSLVPTSTGFLAVWNDRNPDLNLHAAAWMSNGALAPGWPTGGSTVCNAVGDQKNAVVLPSPTGGAFVAWEDSRNGNLDIVATRVEAAVPVSVPLPGAPALAFLGIAPNPARDVVRVDLALGSGERATLDLVDVRGRVRAHADAAASSTIPLRGLAPGLYWLRVARAGVTATARLAIVR